MSDADPYAEWKGWNPADFAACSAYDDRYFGWDAARFASRRDHNLVRARGQLALANAVRAARADIMDIVLAGT